jgi:uncharacterized protein YdeI (YjbR/CyaY-like superfamily)
MSLFRVRESRLVEAPDDFESALATDPHIREIFDRLSYTHRKEYVVWITGAKREETRRRRIEQAMTMLREGTKTPL